MSGLGWLNVHKLLIDQSGTKHWYLRLMLPTVTEIDQSAVVIVYVHNIHIYCSMYTYIYIVL